MSAVRRAAVSSRCNGGSPRAYISRGAQLLPTPSSGLLFCRWLRVQAKVLGSEREAWPKSIFPLQVWRETWRSRIPSSVCSR